LTALLHRYRTEGNTPIRQALSIGLGLYIGASPFIGFHLGLIFLFGWLLGLNRLKAYLASHISNPLFAPILYAVEIQIGAWIRTGHMYSTVSLAQLQFGPLALDVLIGSVVVGGVLAVTGTIVTYALMGGRRAISHDWPLDVGIRPREARDGSGVSRCPEGRRAARRRGVVRPRMRAGVDVVAAWSGARSLSER
jgi:uncharacterized protein (DUF2062 family)